MTLFELVNFLTVKGFSSSIHKCEGPSLNIYSKRA